MKGVLAYTVESRPVGDTRTMRAHAVAVCQSCDGEYALAMPHGANNPEATGERFRREGFEFNPFKRSSVRCPGCIERAKRVRASSQKVIAMPKPPTPVATPPAGGATPSAAPAVVTPEQRAKVRDLLTGVFDERGFYLDHYSDQRVAQECGVSAQTVRDMRDVWLGPIKTAPVLDGLLADMAALSERTARHVAEGRLIDEAVGLLNKRLEETRRQLGVAS